MIRDVLFLGLQIGLLYGPLALGVYLAINVLSLPDLTLEGSFGLGGAASATGLVLGLDPVSALLLGMCAGALAGLTTAILHVVLQMNVLLAGILMTTAAWSVSIIVMGTGNISLVRAETLFVWAEAIPLGNQAATILVGGVVTLLFGLFLTWLLGTGFGLATRVTGLNIQTARSMGIRTEMHQVIGLMLANALAAASGALVAQSQGFMDVSIQGGVIVVGLAALTIGMSVMRSDRIAAGVLSVVAGVVIYRCIVALSLRMGIPPNAVKLITAILVFAFVAARIHGKGIFTVTSFVGWQARRRKHMQFLENDRVAPLF
ncbi:ABC transporter permease [Mesorhizobium qingshengii]|uniref:ABC transporter permease n=1 Tax=Mesorhizobium qingshengii TaxID=1165689 RepID=A0ABT4QY67_9HYPH|nr:ABC transporter permease [Mesorhizobium qingshengii]MCZ8546503.1 ABC transporter permease [Mesorhizobium qingshengii]